MEPGPACWMTLSFLSRRGGKAPAWILSKIPVEQGKRGKEGKGVMPCEIQGFPLQIIVLCIRIPATTTGESCPG